MTPISVQDKFEHIKKFRGLEGNRVVVKDLDGYINVLSRENKGTTFELYFPPEVRKTHAVATPCLPALSRLH